MSEEDTNLSYDTEETETSGSDEQENNTPNGSETESTQGTGRTAQDRIRQLIAENKKLKGLTTADKPSASQEVPEDKLWKAKMETKISAPEHLKAQSDDIASYAAKHGVPIEDAITLFDARNKVSKEDADAMSAAQTEASQSRTGGTANPAARQETSAPKELSNDELITLGNQAFAQGK